MDELPSPSAADLDLWVASRRRRVQRSRLDWYVAAFAAVLVGAMVSSAVRDLTVPLLVLPMTVLPGVLAGAVGVLGTVMGLASWLVGPLSLDAPVVWWIASGPVDRGDLLARPFWRLVVLAPSGASYWPTGGASWPTRSRAAPPGARGC